MYSTRHTCASCVSVGIFARSHVCLVEIPTDHDTHTEHRKMYAYFHTHTHTHSHRHTHTHTHAHAYTDTQNIGTVYTLTGNVGLLCKRALLKSTIFRKRDLYLDHRQCIYTKWKCTYVCSVCALVEHVLCVHSIIWILHSVCEIGAKYMLYVWTHAMYTCYVETYVRTYVCSECAREHLNITFCVWT